MKKVMVGVLLGVMLLSSGCASMLVASASKDRVQRRAIQAMAMPGGVGIGIDLLSWDVLTEQPFMQLGAAVVDAATLYYGYQAVNSMQDQTSHKEKTTTIVVTGNGNNTTVVNGDGNSDNGSQDNSDKTNQ